MTRFEIYEGFIEELRKKVEKIQRKCQRLGCRFSYSERGEVFKTINGITYRFIVVETEGIARVNGWEFVASVEHTPAGNLIRKAVVDVEIPERYRTSDTYCEHCMTRRNRNDVYLVMNEYGDFKQVGKNCLCDFTRGMSAEAAAQMASLRDMFEQYSNVQPEENWGTGFRHGRAYIPTAEVLAYAVEAVRGFGYVKADADGISTKYRVMDFYQYRALHQRGIPEYNRHMEQEMVHFNPEADEVKAEVEKMIAWVKGQEVKGDYMNNLFVAVSNEYCDYRRFGILVSLVPVYQRAMEREAAQKAETRTAGHVGNVGDRITVKVETQRCVAAFNTDFGYMFIYKFTDAEGNIYIWKTGKDVEDARELTGTIKAHDEYNGVKQNILTRCKVA